MKIDTSDLLLIVGIVMIVSGAYLISLPVVLISVGVMLIAAAWLVERITYIRRSNSEAPPTA